jgi:DNA polymerase III delta prime subunit
MNTQDIQERLNGFIESKQVPILFHGKSGRENARWLMIFLSNIYKNNQVLLKEQRDARQLFAKGIKFVREDLKNFAKSNINTSHGIFKSVVLYNADYLTIDAQSALRRCIEIFKHPLFHY